MFYLKNILKSKNINFNKLNLNIYTNNVLNQELNLDKNFFFETSNIFKLNLNLNINENLNKLLLLLKKKNNTIMNINTKNIINYYGIISIKSSGINTFVTLTNSLGNVILSLSAGMFNDIKKVKDKKSLNIIRTFGELIAYKTYKCNFKYIFFNIRLDSLKLRSIIRNFYEGFIINHKFIIYKINFYRPITRNGVKKKNYHENKI